MKPSEAAQVLSKIQAFDRRTVGEADILAWAEALTQRRLSVEECLAAVTKHYAESTDFAMPAHIIRIATERRQQVIRHRQPGEILDFPSGLTWAQENRWRQEYWLAIYAGHPDPVDRADQMFGSHSDGFTISRPERVVAPPQWRREIEALAESKAIPEDVA